MSEYCSTIDKLRHFLNNIKCKIHTAANKQTKKAIENIYAGMVNDKEAIFNIC